MIIENFTTTLTEELVQKIDSFLARMGVGTTFFQSPAYYKSCYESPKTHPFYFIAFSSNKIVGVLLVVRQVQMDSPLLNFFSSRDVIIGGPLVENNSSDIYTLLLEHYSTSSSLPVYTEVRNLIDLDDKKDIFKAAGFGFEDHLNIKIDLGQPVEQLLKKVDSTRRYEIKRSSREGCIVAEDTSIEALEACYVILQEIYKRAQLPLAPITYFYSLLHHSTSSFGLKIFVAKLDDKVIGCMLCILSNNTIYDYYAGAFHSYTSKYPNALLPWEVVKWGKERGYEVFDFGGAGKPDIPYGVRDYKLKFGGKLVNYGRFIKINHAATYKISVFAFNLLRSYIR